MSTVRKCPECGTELPSGVEPWLCPNCLLAQAANKASAEPNVASTSTSAEATRVGEAAGPFPRPFGGYELLERIGNGGMGIVYRARQISLDRIVALKVLPFGALATKEQVLRFRTEAAAAGSLQHPNIVAIHEVGLWEDRHYLVMDYVAGQTLAEVVRAGPLPPRRAARYVQTIAEAVHYAHEHGILHRDLKPSNVLIDAADQPRITDFGLAKRLEFGTDLTLSGQVLGSPQYMPPEQASGRQRQVGRRSDVYALGAILYHLLTSRPPFVGETLSDILPQVANDEPLRPRQLNSAVPADLETVCLKCLEKEMHRRYPTALALAEELGRYLRGEPTVARPVGIVGRVWRWSRRKPQVAGLAAVATLAVVIGFAGVLWQWRQAEAQRVRAEEERARAEANEYILSINVAQQSLKASNPGSALELLNRYRPSGKSEIRNPKSETDRRGFEWRYLWQQCQTEAEALVGQLSSRVITLDASRDGRWLLAGCDGGMVKLWNLETREEIELTPDRGWPNYGTFSPNSRLAVFSEQSPTVQGTLAVWDLEARKRLPSIPGDGRPVGAPAFSADGRWLGYGMLTPAGTSAANRTIAVIEFATLEKVGEATSRTPNVDLRKGMNWVFIPGRMSAIGSEIEPDCQFVLADFGDGVQLQYFPAHREGITAMAISPDGRLLASGAGYTDHAVRLWEIPSFRPAGELDLHEAWITDLKFSPDGRTLASASADETIRLWDVSTRTPRRVYTGLGGEVSRVCYSADGQKLFGGMADGSIYRWSASTEPLPRNRNADHLQTGLEAVAIARDGTQFAGLQQGAVYLGRLSGGHITSLPELGTNTSSLQFSADGEFLFAGNTSGEVLVWSLARHQVQARLKGPYRIHWMGQDALGRILVAVGWREGKAFQAFPPGPHTVSVWRTSDWREQPVINIPGVRAEYAVTPDGSSLAVALFTGNLEVRSLTNPARTNTLVVPGSMSAVAFSPDRKLLAAATGEGAVRVWAWPALREVKRFRARSGGMSALAFSPDSRRLATAGARGAALDLWEVATWQRLITLECLGETLQQIAFSADGNQLTAQSSKGDLLCWRVPSLADIATKQQMQKPR